MKKQQKPEVHMFSVWTSLNDESEAEYEYAETANDALLLYLVENTALQGINNIVYHVRDHGAMKDPDDRA